MLSGCGLLSQSVSSRPYKGAKPMRDSNNVQRWQESYKGKTDPYTVLGRTYYPLSDARGYSEVGVASWYGSDFHNKKTASGDIFDMYAISAAHKTLPLGTVVRVINLGNGRQVDLLVNDRGPFVGERIIDLSYGAAKAIGSDGAGLARVRVTAIGSYTQGAPGTAYAAAPQAQRRAAAAPQPRQQQARSQPVQQAAENRPQAVAQYYYVQVGSFSQPDNARRLRDRLAGQGFAGSRVKTVNRGGRDLHMVQAGAFRTLDEARAALIRLRVEFPESFIES